RLGNQVFGAEADVVSAIGGRHHFVLLFLGQLGDGVHRGHFHFARNGGGADIKRPAENVRKAQDVVDLVRVVGTARGHDDVVAHGMGVFGQDLGIGVG